MKRKHAEKVAESANTDRPNRLNQAGGTNNVLLKSTAFPRSAAVYDAKVNTPKQSCSVKQ